jgi:8-oxo-dGTP diphosphatase
VRVCAGLLYREGHIFLGKRAASRASYPSVWDLPGGHCEPGETLERTLARELQEEIGVTPVTAVPLASFQVSGGGGDEVELSVYLVTYWQGEPQNLLPEEHDAVGWFTIDQACRLALASSLYPDLFRHAAYLSEKHHGSPTIM